MVDNEHTKQTDDMIHTKFKVYRSVIAGLAVFFITLILLFILFNNNRIPSSGTLCGANLKELGAALFAFEKQKGHLPDRNKWQDELIGNGNCYEQQFVCPHSSLKGSSYAINTYIYDLPFDQLPEDMVVLFEAKPFYDGAINLSYGPEIINLANHDGWGINVLFANGKVCFVKGEAIMSLKWSTDPDFYFPENTIYDIIFDGKGRLTTLKKLPWLVIAILVAIASLGTFVAIYLRRHVTAYLFISVVVAILWGVRNNSLEGLRTTANFWCSLPFWISACYVMHAILVRSKKRSQEMFVKSLPVLVGLTVGTTLGILWAIATKLIGLTDIERYIVVGPWIANIASGGLWGLGFGAFEGFVWKKLFVVKKSDSSDASDRSDKE